MNEIKLPSEDELKELPKDGGDLYNRLVFEKSSYLKSHAHQKINWYSWGQDAFDLAKITDKPLFLSIGYAACHWCHVMSDRTFDLDDIAALLNTHFVAIKIDRDELPDIDQIYMSATQLLNHHGGWPNSVFCLPTGQPFYAGTYFPPDDHDNGPGFRTLLSQLAESWGNNRSEIELQAQELEQVIKKMNHFEKDSFGSMQFKTNYNLMKGSIQQRFDNLNGGFGGAPKFPPFSTIRLLLQDINDNDLDMALFTLDQMALGGIYDQVNGGFHRYSTDSEWHCPHFEKMLTDNAQMIELYSLAYAKKPTKLYKKIVGETIQHLLDDWCKDGVFIHSIDADSEGVEGLYYTYTYDELANIFKENDFDYDFGEFCDFFQIKKSGNMIDEATNEKTGANILNPQSENFHENWPKIREKCVKFRTDNRLAPLKNEAISLSGNALLVYAIYTAADIFSNAQWMTVAHHLFSQLLTILQEQEDSVYFDDVIYLFRAYLFFENDRDQTVISYLWNFVMDRFYDPLQGGLWFSQVLHKTPISRIKDIYDQATPSPNAIFIQLALDLYKRYKEPQYYKIALESISCFMATAFKNSQGCESFWLGIEQYWTLFKQQELTVQFVDCIRAERSIRFTIDFFIPNEYFVILVDSLSFYNLDSEYDWKQLTIDPYKSRRVDWSDEIVRCANGNIRLSGICDIENCPEVLQLEIPVCNDTECLTPIKIDLPVIDA